MSGLGITKDGYIKASQLEEILVGMGEAIKERFAEIENRQSEMRKEIKSLRSEVDTERRLRLGRRMK